MTSQPGSSRISIRDRNVMGTWNSKLPNMILLLGLLSDRLAPRHQRDLPRILGLIKAHALLNVWHPEAILNNLRPNAGGSAVVREGGFEPPKAYAIGS